MKFLKKIICKILRIKSFKEICFSRDLNCWTVFDCLNEMGNAFHNVGAATEKHLSPKEVIIFSRGKSSRNPSFDHSWYADWFLTEIKLLIYCGYWPSKDLKTIKSIIKEIRNLTCSQECRGINMAERRRKSIKPCWSVLDFLQLGDLSVWKSVQ